MWRLFLYIFSNDLMIKNIHKVFQFLYLNNSMFQFYMNYHQLFIKIRINNQLLTFFLPGHWCYFKQKTHCQLIASKEFIPNQSIKKSRMYQHCIFDAISILSRGDKIVASKYINDGDDFLVSLSILAPLFDSTTTKESICNGGVDRSHFLQTNESILIIFKKTYS